MPVSLNLSRENWRITFCVSQNNPNGIVSILKNYRYYIFCLLTPAE